MSMCVCVARPMPPRKVLRPRLLRRPSAARAARARTHLPEPAAWQGPVSYTHLRAHETSAHL
eukprot:12844429-Alexandrium_andersonii.AAC.1